MDIETANISTGTEVLTKTIKVTTDRGEATYSGAVRASARDGELTVYGPANEVIGGFGAGKWVSWEFLTNGEGQ